MGAIDLVVQIEAPPSVASGMQRIGRASHQVGARQRRRDLPEVPRRPAGLRGGHARACTTDGSRRRGYPRNPLDVLAQQIVAMVAMEPWHVDDLFARVRRPRRSRSSAAASFEGVLDMLSGRYPSDEFAELRPRAHVGSH